MVVATETSGVAQQTYFFDRISSNANRGRPHVVADRHMMRHMPYGFTHIATNAHAHGMAVP